MLTGRLPQELTTGSVTFIATAGYSVLVQPYFNWDSVPYGTVSVYDAAATTKQARATLSTTTTALSVMAGQLITRTIPATSGPVGFTGTFDRPWYLSRSTTAGSTMTQSITLVTLRGIFIQHQGMASGPFPGTIRVPAAFGVKAPASSYDQNAAAATRLSFPGAVYYPFWASAQLNVATPVMFPSQITTSAWQTDTDKVADYSATLTYEGYDYSYDPGLEEYASNTFPGTYEDVTWSDLTLWKYSWSADTLFWSSVFEDTADTLRNSSSEGSGTVSPLGVNSTQFHPGGTLWGGVNHFSSRAESAQVPTVPLSVMEITRSNQSTGFSTGRLSASTLSTFGEGTIRANTALPAYFTWAEFVQFMEPLNAVLEFTRNGSFSINRGTVFLP